MKPTATLAFLPVIAAMLASCGSERGGNDELMRRVAQAEQAAARAEAAATRAEAAAARSGGGSTSAEPETVYEAGPDMDPSYGEGIEPVPLDG